MGCISHKGFVTDDAENPKRRQGDGETGGRVFQSPPSILTNPVLIKHPPISQSPLLPSSPRLPVAVSPPSSCVLPCLFAANESFHDRLLHVQTVFSFVDHYRLRRVDHA